MTWRGSCPPTLPTKHWAPILAVRGWWVPRSVLGVPRSVLGDSVLGDTHQWRGATRRWARPGLCHGVADVFQATRGLSRRAGSPARACPYGQAGRTNGSDSSATTCYTRGTCARRTWGSWRARQLLIEFGARHLVKCHAWQRGISPSTIHGGSWENCLCRAPYPRILPLHGVRKSPCPLSTDTRAKLWCKNNTPSRHASRAPLRALGKRTRLAV